MIVMRWPWHTGDKTVDSILLRGFGIYFIMIYYSSFFESRYELRDWCKVRLH
jgi:hypothetical protein